MTSRTAILLGLVLALGACEPPGPPPPPPLSPAELAAKARAECIEVAIQQSGFDPTLAEAPPRTISTTAPRGGDVVGSGAVAKGAAKGAIVGVIGGAIAGDAGTGAAIGAGAGALLGGARRHRETKEMVTTTRPNPDYERYIHAKSAYKNTFESCFAQRSAPPAPAEVPQ